MDFNSENFQTTKDVVNFYVDAIQYVRFAHK